MSGTNIWRCYIISGPNTYYTLNTRFYRVYKLFSTFFEFGEILFVFTQREHYISLVGHPLRMNNHLWQSYAPRYIDCIVSVWRCESAFFKKLILKNLRDKPLFVENLFHTQLRPLENLNIVMGSMQEKKVVVKCPYLRSESPLTFWRKCVLLCGLSVFKRLRSLFRCGLKRGALLELNILLHCTLVGQPNFHHLFYYGHHKGVEQMHILHWWIASIFWCQPKILYSISINDLLLKYISASLTFL